MRDTPVDIGKAITAYLKSDAVQNLFSDLKNWAEGQHVPCVAEMNCLTVGLLKVFHVKSGHRVVDAFGKGFTQGRFALACDSAPAINPYKLATPGTPNTTTSGDIQTSC